MGERAGYRVRVGKEISPLLRKQWFVGDERDTIRKLMKKVSITLSKTFGDKTAVANDGGIALRSDLDIGRLTMAFFDVLYDPPFDSLEFGTNCDISDHGIYELEMIKWDKWIFSNYPVEFETIGHGNVLAEIEFEAGTKKMKFHWIGGKK
jgi:hypothetical protein